MAVTSREETRRRLALVWGAQSSLIGETQDIERVVSEALEAARTACLAQSGDRVAETALY